MAQLTHLSLFSGIGGLDLAAEMAGFKTIGQCEWADFPTKVLEKHWPSVPRWRDVRELTVESFRRRCGGGIHQPSYQGDFHANPTALLENVMRLTMSAICGMSFSESIARPAPSGLWEKMFRGFYQVNLVGSSEEFSGTWPNAGVLHGGIVFRPMLSELNTSASAFASWPRPIASDGAAWKKNQRQCPMKSIQSCWKRGKQDRTIYYHIQNGLNPMEAATVNGMMMGFPEGWTD